MGGIKYIPELFELSNVASEGELGESDIKRLEVLLSGSDEACEQWLELMRFHADVAGLAALGAAEREALDRLAVSRVSSQACLPSTSSRSGRASALLWSRPTVGVFAAAALVCIAVTLFSWHEGWQQIAPRAVESQLAKEELFQVVRLPLHVASLTNATDADWGEGTTYEGQFYAEGDIVNLKGGTAQLSMVSGADIVLQAPCSLELVSDRVVRLLKGKVTIQVAEWASGFVLETQGLRITDLGTRFAVSAESPDAVEAHVLEGAILAEPVHLREERDAKLLLVSGQAIRVGKQAPRIDRLEADRDRFVDELSAFHPYRQIPIHNTGQGIEIGEDDPHWSIVSASESLGDLPRAASVNPPHPRYSDNMPESSQWISFQQGTTEGVLNYSRKNEIITFRTSVDLTGFDPSTVSITAQVLADNGVQAIRLNGKPIKMASWADDRFRQMFCEFREIVINDGFVAGENQIEFDVINLPIRQRRKVQLNAMALRVEWQAFGRPVIDI